MTPSAAGSRGAHRDPRSIVTPDAFAVEPGLLGTQLAAPARRLGAILIDLLVIGFLTAVTKSFALVLGIIVAVLFVRAGFKRVAVRGNVFDRAMRASVGCLGLVVGLVTIIVWSSVGSSFGDGPEAPPGAIRVDGIRVGARTAIAGAAGGIAFANARTLREAEESARLIVDLGRDLGLGDSELRALLRDLAPPEASWATESERLIARVLEGDAPGDSEAVTEEDPLPALDPAWGDSVSRLEERVAILSGELSETQDDLADVEAALEDRAGTGAFSWLRDLVDELGFGFGWATLYMTVVLTWWKGQTVGKRLLGIRVVRLDGEPITWWTAFERAGGYAAGFATGLLGFAQIYWDANRQAIHDRIVGTVVVREGAPKVIDWESAL